MGCRRSEANCTRSSAMNCQMLVRLAAGYEAAPEKRHDLRQDLRLQHLCFRPYWILSTTDVNEFGVLKPVGWDTEIVAIPALTIVTGTSA